MVALVLVDLYISSTNSLQLLLVDVYVSSSISRWILQLLNFYVYIRTQIEILRPLWFFDLGSNSSNVPRDLSFEVTQILFVHLVSAYENKTLMVFYAPSRRAHRAVGGGSIAMGGARCFHAPSFGINF